MQAEGMGLGVFEMGGIFLERRRNIISMAKMKLMRINFMLP